MSEKKPYRITIASCISFWSTEIEQRGGENFGMSFYFSGLAIDANCTKTINQTYLKNQLTEIYYQIYFNISELRYRPSSGSSSSGGGGEKHEIYVAAFGKPSYDLFLQDLGGGGAGHGPLLWIRYYRPESTGFL